MTKKPCKRFRKGAANYWKTLAGATISDLNWMFTQDDAVRIIHDAPNTAAILGKNTYFESRAHEIIYEFKSHSIMLADFRKYILRVEARYQPSVERIIGNSSFRLTRQSNNTVWLYVRIPILDKEEEENEELNK